MRATNLEDDVDEETDKLRARVRQLEEAIEMTLLYHSLGPWDASKRLAWERWAGADADATSRVLCDRLRNLRGQP